MNDWAPLSLQRVPYQAYEIAIKIALNNRQFNHVDLHPEAAIISSKGYIYELGLDVGRKNWVNEETDEAAGTKRLGEII